MKLSFLGTRGYTEIATRRHRRHSTMIVGYHGHRMMVDCGEDWLGRLEALHPQAIVLTHAHPDHAWGLRAGAPCPVFATRETWDHLPYEIAERRIVVARRPVRIAGITFEAFPVEHSTRAGAIFTHCGTEVITTDERRLGARLRAMARECGVAAAIAHDGLSLTLRA